MNKIQQCIQKANVYIDVSGRWAMVEDLPKIVEVVLNECLDIAEKNKALNTTELIELLKKKFHNE